MVLQIIDRTTNDLDTSFPFRELLSANANGSVVHESSYPGISRVNLN